MKESNFFFILALKKKFPFFSCVLIAILLPENFIIYLFHFFLSPSSRLILLILLEEDLLFFLLLSLFNSIDSKKNFVVINCRRKKSRVKEFEGERVKFRKGGFIEFFVIISFLLLNNFQDFGKGF